jgi:hypothetical protein
MRLSVEILDHIFSFLVPHRKTLIACSKDSLLSPIVERHLYYHVIVHFGKRSSDADYAFEPDDLSRLVCENPRILCYVRILEIQVEGSRHLDGFADTLPRFSVLECVVLTPTNHNNWCDWSYVFRAALEDRLSLPTVKEVHFRGFATIPISLFDNLKNVKNLSLSGSSDVDRYRSSASTLLQLESLRLSTQFNPQGSSLLAWIKLHIKELRSLKCVFYLGQLSELLGGCSGTLNNLDIDFEPSRCMVLLSSKSLTLLH